MIQRLSRAAFQRVLALTLLAGLGACSGGDASRAGAPAPRGVLAITHENDLFAGMDRHYTAGQRAAYTPKRAPGWAKRAAGSLLSAGTGEARATFAVSQRLFTAGDLDAEDPADDARPYAGHLEGEMALAAVGADRYKQLTLGLGVVGPASLAEEAQDLIHAFVPAEEPQGWGTQLPNEATVQLGYRQGWRAFEGALPGGWAYDVIPSVNAALGTVRVEGGVGGLLRFGPELDDGFGPPVMAPSLAGALPGAPSRASGFGWHLFAGGEGRLIGRDLFLDGTLFQDSRSTDKLPAVADLVAGVALDFTRVRLSYTQVVRTKQYHAQEDFPDSFASITLAVRL